MKLILISQGLNVWSIYEPGYSFGDDDRRYTEVAVVKGNLWEAMSVLKRIERGDDEEET